METYFEQELQKTVQTINRLNGEHCLTFSLLADVHIHPERPEFMLRYVHYYNYERPAAALGHKSPIQYKTELGF